MFMWSNSTLAGAICRLSLALSPVVVLWALVSALLLVHQEAQGHLLAIGILALGPVMTWRMVKGCLVQVPLGQVSVVENRNTQRVHVLLAGYHVCLPVLYRRRPPSDVGTVLQKRILANVLVKGGPPVKMQITYTLQHSLPTQALRLPQSEPTEPAFRHEMQIVANIDLQSRQSEMWQRQHTIVLDECLRAFFGDVTSKQLYDPTGHEQLAHQVLCCRLNHFLKVHMDHEQGIRVYVNCVELQVDAEQPPPTISHLRRVA